MDAEEISAVRAVVTEVLDRAGDNVDPLGNRPGDWSAWQAAGLTALPVPEEYGGDGLGLEAIAVLLRESGRRAQLVPAWETLACAALTLGAHGTEAQRKEHLAAIVEGAVLTPALTDVHGTTAAYADGRVSGRKAGVTYADTATALLVVAGDDVVLV
uniref:acyl-CoA dehydrogenase family protein n=1 Tax=Nocardioides stalactiti TaxID=2755356 RepID=UPI0016049925